MSLITQLTATFAAIGSDMRSLFNWKATAETKLNGIEAGATKDQTPAEIKTAYESNSNTNAFTDAERAKLTGIEAGATGDMTSAQIKAAYESNSNTNPFTDSEKTKVGRLTISSNINIDDLASSVAAIGDNSITLRGTYDVTGKSVFPSGAKKGYSYIIVGSATIAGYELNEGDRLISLKTTASTTLAADWFHADGSDKVTAVNGRVGNVTGLQEAAAIGDTNRNFLGDYTTARDA